MSNISKRPRLDLSVAPTSTDAGISGFCPANSTQMASSINDPQGRSIFFSNATNNSESIGMLPSNVFLTICDDNSDESQEYLTIDGRTLAHIKQEQQDALCMGNVSSSSTQATQTLPMQYRIVNQLANVDNITSSGGEANNATSALDSTLPMQLSNGCEIYIVKEYVDNIPTMLTEDRQLLQEAQDEDNGPTTGIKLDPDSCVTSTAGRVGVAAASVTDGIQIVNNSLPYMFTTKLANASNDKPTNGAPVAARTTGNLNSSNVKRSYVLEAYKKRDDRRRATHNEVERRRRDKINNWIFKLKEMLPTETANINNQQSNTVTSLEGIVERATLKNNGTTTNSNNSSTSRTPPNDSKSQILIKACEYIKAMQDEIKSLRECLSENENLRLSNQRLHNELTKLRSERAVTAGTTLHTRNFNITLNRLNNSNSNGSAGSASNSPIGNSGIFGNLNINPNVTSMNTYTKRELIIRDYVD